MANQATTALVRSYSWDCMGRWASIRLQTAESRYLQIISAYQACENIRPGLNLVAAQQQAQMLEEDSMQSVTENGVRKRQTDVNQQPISKHKTNQRRSRVPAQGWDTEKQRG